MNPNNIFRVPRNRVACFILMAASLAGSNSLFAGPNQGEVLKLDVNQAIRVGVANHFLLNSIRNKSAAIKALLTERWRAYLPSVGVSYNRTRDIHLNEQDQISHEVRLNIQQVIYDGGRRALNVDLARIDGLLAREDFRITYNRLRLNIQKAYLRTLAARGKVLLNHKSLARARQQLKQARLEERLGLSTRLASLTVASRVREIELALKSSQNEFTQSLHDLKLILNLDFELKLDLRGNLFRDFILFPPIAKIEDLITRARSQRSEIKRSLANIHKLRKEKEIAEDAWVPRLSVGGFMGRSGEKFPVRQKSWGVNFTLSFPIGSSSVNNNAGTGVSRDKSTSGSNTSTGIQFMEDLGYDRRVLESKNALGEGQSEHRRLMNRLAIEVRKSYDGMRETWESIRIGNGRVYFQYESLGLMNTRYQVGDVKRADIVLAETELVQAQEDLTDAIAGYMSAVYDLEFASGLEPGQLKLFVYRPGKGNTLLSRLLYGDAKLLKRPLKKLKPEDESPAQTDINLPEITGDDSRGKGARPENTDSEFLINDVDID